MDKVKEFEYLLNRHFENSYKIEILDLYAIPYNEGFLDGIRWERNLQKTAQKKQTKGKGRGRFKKWLKSAFPRLYDGLFYE